MNPSYSQTLPKRALYNALRMNYLRDHQTNKSPALEAWQIEDYRAKPLDTLLKKLKTKGIALDRVSFLALADDPDTPEQLTDQLISELNVNPKDYDQIYLLLFELWRRFIPEKQTLTLLCDELDHQIDLYDRQINGNVEGLQDILANLNKLLDENVDQGIQPKDAFATITQGCANDIESFLIDFILDQIDNKNDSYALDLIESFKPYVQNKGWFDLLHARVLIKTDSEQSEGLMRSVIKESNKHPDLELHFELLALLSQGGSRDLLATLVKQILPQLETEEDYRDLLALVIDYFHFFDEEEKEKAVQQILLNRQHINPETPFDQKSNRKELLKLLA